MSTYTGSIWKMDTVNHDKYKMPILIRKLVWKEPTAGHTIDLEDSFGNEIFATTAQVGGVGAQISHEVNSVVSGLNLKTLGSGTLFIYIG